MNEFSKQCPVCNLHFTKLTEFMQHVKNDHKDIPPDKILEIGKEQKWRFREPK